jgi:hypothetical protein
MPAYTHCIFGWYLQTPVIRSSGYKKQNVIMEQLEITKGKSVVIPKIVSRFIVMYYDKFIGWKCEYQVFTTPESATQDFIQRQEHYPNSNIMYYKIV